MSHPKDRRHRFIIGETKGKRRGYRYWNGLKNIKDETEREKWLERAFYLRRDTTKLCSCNICGNPRRVAWFKGDQLTMQEKRQENWKEDSGL